MRIIIVFFASRWNLQASLF